MKRLLVIILSIAIMATFAACGCMRSTPNETTAPTSNTTTAPTTMPDMIPPIESNIPDPNVDTEMPIYTDNTEPSGTNDATDNTSNTDANK